MIPTLEDIIRGLLDGTIQPEQARRWLQCHLDLQKEVDVMSLYIPSYEMARGLLDTIRKVKEQDARWGPRQYPSFDAQLEASADTTAAHLASFHNLPTADHARLCRTARQDELSWADILVCEVAKLPERYEDQTALRAQLIDVAGVALQWAAQLTPEPVVVRYEDERHADGTMSVKASVECVDPPSLQEADHEGPRRGI